mgnify:CR=1 FL=1
MLGTRAEKAGFVGLGIMGRSHSTPLHSKKRLVTQVTLHPSQQNSQPDLLLTDFADPLPEPLRPSLRMALSTAPGVASIPARRRVANILRRP